MFLLIIKIDVSTILKLKINPIKSIDKDKKV